eukprot:944013-Alexandrium_andersonii.AAC.1
MEVSDVADAQRPGQLADIMLRLTRRFGCNLMVARPIATWIELCTNGGPTSLGRMPGHVPG